MDTENYGYYCVVKIVSIKVIHEKISNTGKQQARQRSRRV